jgi:hypothetical protein
MTTCGSEVRAAMACTQRRSDWKRGQVYIQAGGQYVDRRDGRSSNWLQRTALAHRR